MKKRLIKMTDDRLVDWMVENGYEFDIDATGDGVWTHKETHETPTVREGRALESLETGRPTINPITREEEVIARDKGTKGFLSAFGKKDGYSVEEDLKKAYDKAKEEVDKIDSLSALKGFNPRKILSDAEQEVRPLIYKKPSGKQAVRRDEFFKLVKDDIEKAIASVDTSYATEIAKEFRNAKTEAQLQKAVDKVKKLTGAKKVTVTKILGIDVNVVGITLPEDKRPTIRPSSVYGAAQSRVKKNLIRQNELGLTSPQVLNQSKTKSVLGVADFWGFDKTDSKDLLEVKNILQKKGFEIYQTPSGQEKFRFPKAEKVA